MCLAEKEKGAKGEKIMNKKHFYAAVILLSFLIVVIQPAFGQEVRTLIDGDTKYDYPDFGAWSGNTFTFSDSPPVRVSIRIINALNSSVDPIIIDGGGKTIDLVNNSEGGTGVNVYNSSYITIMNLNVTNCSTGINLGIYENGVNHIDLIDNNVSNCQHGIHMFRAGTCISEPGRSGITGNNIVSNWSGIEVHSCVSIDIYNNNFIENEVQVTLVDDSSNPSNSDIDFNLDLPTGGNYWSDYTGIDEDNNGIGDTPYTFAGGQDALPWTGPDGWNDTDGDGLGYYAEVNIYGTDPENPDSDDDGLLDGTEVDIAEGSGCPDPLNPDSDGDTLSDGAEVDLGTSPCNVDTDDDGVPDNIDPLPLDPGVTGTYIEEQLREDADYIITIDLNLFTGPNNNANKGRRGSLSNRASAAANQVANANYQEAVNILDSILDRVDGVEKPKDWMGDSTEKDYLVGELMLMIELLGYYL